MILLNGGARIMSHCQFQFLIFCGQFYGKGEMVRNHFFETTNAVTVSCH